MATSKPSTAGKGAKATNKPPEPASKTTAKKAAPAKPAAKTAAAKPAPAASKKPAAAARAKSITSEQAMANTRALLKAKNDKARQPRNYPTGDAGPPGSHGAHGVDAPQSETAPTERLTQAIHGHAYATETGDESKRGQN